MEKSNRTLKTSRKNFVTNAPFFARQPFVKMNNDDHIRKKVRVNRT